MGRFCLRKVSNTPGSACCWGGELTLEDPDLGDTAHLRVGDHLAGAPHRKASSPLGGHWPGTTATLRGSKPTHSRSCASPMAPWPITFHPCLAPPMRRGHSRADAKTPRLVSAGG